MIQLYQIKRTIFLTFICIYIYGFLCMQSKFLLFRPTIWHFLPIFPTSFIDNYHSKFSTPTILFFVFWIIFVVITKIDKKILFQDSYSYELKKEIKKKQFYGFFIVSVPWSMFNSQFFKIIINIILISLQTFFYYFSYKY